MNFNKSCSPGLGYLCCRYYACHCGHIAVVEYLLAHGARCEENTFDGERCIYGALTSEIKCLLYKSKIASMNTWKRDDFDEFCEKFVAFAVIYIYNSYGYDF